LEEDKKLAEEERHVLRKQLEDSRSESWSDKRRMGEKIFVLKNIISELEVKQGGLEDEVHSEYTKRLSVEESLKRLWQKELSTEIEDLKETIEKARVAKSKKIRRGIK
jgi:hypothetical protein